ncbi:MAG: hypothetical protein OXC07_13320 [Kistimonas sp.]|nr:hypothetical protein [Kistimonas sp.]
MHTTTDNTGRPAQSPAYSSLSPPTPGTASISWGTLGVTVALGLTGGFLLNRLAPPAGPTQSLMRYGIALTPAALYMGSYACKSVNVNFRTTGLSDPAAPARQTQADHQHALQMKHKNIISLAHLSAWLGHTSTVDFSDEEILRAAQSISTKHPVPGLVAAAHQTGWQTRALPGSKTQSNQDPLFNTPQTDPRFEFESKLSLIKPDGSTALHLAELEVNDVLLLFLPSTREGKPSCEALAVQRQGDNLFQLFDPGKGEPVCGDTNQVLQFVSQWSRKKSEPFLTLIRLQKDNQPQGVKPTTDPI